MSKTYQHTLLKERSYIPMLFQLFVFSAAMALLESAVVVYLRALYYPDGFTVALKLMDSRILFTEILREAATLIMLGGIAMVSGKKFTERFSYFLYCFAIWDIFYYIWLKALINWPESFLTWDILFLIPVTWLGPVLAPVLCSLTMIALALTLLQIQQQHPTLRIQKTDWFLLTTGSLLILFAFIQDYGRLILTKGWILEMDTLMKNQEFIKIASAYIPKSFNWILFISGELILITGIFIFWLRDYTIESNVYKGI